MIPVPRLAIIIPCYNEQEALPLSIPLLCDLLQSFIAREMAAIGSSIIIVDDGSGDNSPVIIEKFVEEYSSHPDINIHPLFLAANSGQQNALMAGMQFALHICDAAITIDADLQDSPDLIISMLEEYRKGADVVYGVRKSRKSDGWFKRNSAQALYRFMHRLGVPAIYNHGDFRLLSQYALEQICAYKERNLFLRALIPQIGGKQTSLFYDRAPRCAGKTKYPLSRMLNFAADGVTSFSMRPVRWVFFIGLLFLFTALVIFSYVIFRYCRGNTIEGWTSLILSIWFCSGVILIALGIIGEYIGKIYLEVKERPRYHIKNKISSQKSDS